MMGGQQQQQQMVDISHDSRQMDTQLTATANDGPAAWSFTRIRGN